MEEISSNMIPCPPLSPAEVLAKSGEIMRFLDFICIPTGELQVRRMFSPDVLNYRLPKLHVPV